MWALLCDIWQGTKSIIIGHVVTFRNFWRPKITDRYPHRDPGDNWQPGPGYRGGFALLRSDQEDRELRCTACGSCARACPVGCIHIEGEGKGKERHPVSFYIDMGLCVYCHECVEACPADAITMTDEYDISKTSRAALIRDLEQLVAAGEGRTEVSRVV